MSASPIEWTEPTWNPVTGCTQVSSGCKHGYAERVALRLQAMNAPGYARGFDLTLHADRLDPPLERKKPTVYFVGSMADRFHEGVPDAFIERVLATIRRTPRHTDRLLTQRATTTPLLRLLGPLNLDGIHWVIVDGESGPNARPMREAWARAVRDQCRAAKVDFTLKPWGAWGADGVRRDQQANGRLRAGRWWEERPEIVGALL